MHNLSNASQQFTQKLRDVINTATYANQSYENGLKAKEALIRSQTLIQFFHESLKISINNAILQDDRLNQFTWTAHPALGYSTPELKICGELKAKDQDIVFTRELFSREHLEQLQIFDNVGYQASNNAIICGVRSQMSSVDKNFDTLMERAIAEAVNLRMRLQQVTLVELYVIPLQEIANSYSARNIFQVCNKKVKLEKFIRQFYLTTFNPDTPNRNESYMMHATCLLIIDLENNGEIIKDSNELARYGYDRITCNQFSLIQPDGFIDRIITAYYYNNNL